MDQASIMPAPSAREDWASSGDNANFPSQRVITRPDDRGDQPAGDRSAFDPEREPIEAMPRSFSLASRVAIRRRNAVARRKLETLQDRERLRATLAEVWETNGAA
jgi:hypothetical protein